MGNGPSSQEYVETVNTSIIPIAPLPGLYTDFVNHLDIPASLLRQSARINPLQKLRIPFHKAETLSEDQAKHSKLQQCHIRLVGNCLRSSGFTAPAARDAAILPLSTEVRSSKHGLLSLGCHQDSLHCDWVPRITTKDRSP